MSRSASGRHEEVGEDLSWSALAMLGMVRAAHLDSRHVQEAAERGEVGGRANGSRWRPDPSDLGTCPARTIERFHEAVWRRAPQQAAQGQPTAGGVDHACRTHCVLLLGADRDLSACVHLGNRPHMPEWAARLHHDPVGWREDAQAAATFVGPLTAAVVAVDQGASRTSDDHEGVAAPPTLAAGQRIGGVGFGGVGLG